MGLGSVDLSHLLTKVVHDGDHDDNGHRVQVVEQVIGHTMSVHSGSQGVTGGTDTSIVKLDDGLGNLLA